MSKAIHIKFIDQLMQITMSKNFCFFFVFCLDNQFRFFLLCQKFVYFSFKMYLYMYVICTSHTRLVLIQYIYFWFELYYFLSPAQSQLSWDAYVNEMALSIAVLIVILIPPHINSPCPGGFEK